jgi:hypothetical protein
MKIICVINVFNLCNKKKKKLKTVLYEEEEKKKKKRSFFDNFIIKNFLPLFKS